MGKLQCSPELYVSATEEMMREVREAMDIAKKDLGKYVDVSAILNQLQYPPPPPPLFPNITTDDDNDDDDDDDDDAYVDDDDVDNDYLEMMSKKVEEVLIQQKQLTVETVQTGMMMGYLGFGFGGVYPPWHIHFDEIASIVDRCVSRSDKAMEIYHEKLGLPPFVNPVARDDCSVIVNLFKQHQQQQKQQK